MSRPFTENVEKTLAFSSRWWIIDNRNNLHSHFLKMENRLINISFDTASQTSVISCLGMENSEVVSHQENKHQPVKSYSHAQWHCNRRLVCTSIHCPDHEAARLSSAYHTIFHLQGVALNLLFKDLGYCLV